MPSPSFGLAVRDAGVALRVHVSPSSSERYNPLSRVFVAFRLLPVVVPTMSAPAGCCLFSRPASCTSAPMTPLSLLVPYAIDTRPMGSLLALGLVSPELLGR